MPTLLQKVFCVLAYDLPCHLSTKDIWISKQKGMEIVHVFGCLNMGTDYRVYSNLYIGFIIKIQILNLLLNIVEVLKC